MSAFVQLVSPDGQATPVNHNFVPDRIDAAGTAFYEGDQTVYAARERVTLQVQRPKKGRNTRRITTLTLAIPVMDETDPTLKVDEELVVVKYYIPTASSVARAKDLRVILSGLMYTAAVVDAVDAGRSAY